MQIQQLLVAAKAEKVMFDYEDQRLAGIAFQMRTPDGGVIAFDMPANVSGVFAVLRKSKIPNRLKTTDHATNVAWRIQKDWVEAQIAKVQCGMSQMHEVFMPYIITDNGKRMFERIAESGFKAIGWNSEREGES